MSHTALQDRLKGSIPDALKKELHISNVHAVPKITRVIVNVGLNQGKYGSKELQEFIAESLATITGQKPSIRRARKAVSNFKIRENMVVGLVVTLHGKQMQNFLDRFISYALPRIRDFRGLSMKLDGHGNYSIGIKDQSIFPELPPPEAHKIFGMQIQISTNAGSDQKALALLKQMGFPFKKEKKEKDETNGKNTTSEKSAEIEKSPKSATNNENAKSAMNVKSAEEPLQSSSSSDSSLSSDLSPEASAKGEASTKEDISSTSSQSS